MELLGCLHYPLQHSVKGDFYFFSQCYKRTYAFIFFNDQSAEVDVPEEIVVAMFVLEYCPRGVTVGFVHAACVCEAVWWLLWLLF